jgi:hypothetical protein
MMEAASTSETSVNFYQTETRNIPEDSHLQIRCRENLKSHQLSFTVHVTDKIGMFTTFLIVPLLFSRQIFT